MDKTCSVLLDEQQLNSILRILAAKILTLAEVEKIHLVGIKNGGVSVAQRLVTLIHEEMNGPKLDVSSIDIALYRDDLPETAVPLTGKVVVNFKVTGSRILIIDDVIQTGRTVRAAMDALFDLGRPKSIHVCALLDRGGRELPIAVELLGMIVSVRQIQTIDVLFSDKGGHVIASLKSK